MYMLFLWVDNKFYWHIFVTITALSHDVTSFRILDTINNYMVHAVKKKYWSIYKTFIFRKYILRNVTNNFIWFNFNTS